MANRHETDRTLEQSIEQVQVLLAGKPEENLDTLGLETTSHELCGFHVLRFPNGPVRPKKLDLIEIVAESEEPIRGDLPHDDSRTGFSGETSCVEFWGTTGYGGPVAPAPFAWD